MFCINCGTELEAQAKFCHMCGHSVNVKTNSSPNVGNDEAGILIIKRENQWFAVNPSIKVVVDRTQTYALENGATLYIPVSAGTHDIAFSCGLRKNSTSVNVVNTTTLNVSWNRITGTLEVK